MTELNQLDWQRTNLDNIEEAWQGDLWDRRRLGIQLTNYVDRLQCGVGFGCTLGRGIFLKENETKKDDRDLVIFYVSNFVDNI